MADQPNPQPKAIKQNVMQRLSKRENEIVQLLANGLRVRAIASKLGLSAKTISTYRARAMLKLRIKTTAQLMQYWHGQHPETLRPTEAVEWSTLFAPMGLIPPSPSASPYSLTDGPVTPDASDAQESQ